MKHISILESRGRSTFSRASLCFFVNLDSESLVDIDKDFTREQEEKVNRIKDEIQAHLEAIDAEDLEFTLVLHQ